MSGKLISAPCGTRSAYKRHRRRKETPCTECKNAHAEWHRNYYKTQKKTKP